MASEELRALLRRLLGRLRRPQEGGGSPGPAGERRVLEPASAFEAVVEERLRTLERETGEVKGRVNSLLFLVAAAVVERIVSGLLIS